MKDFDIKQDGLDLRSDEIESVQQQETHYVILGRILKTKGLKIFCYDRNTSVISEVEVEEQDTVYLTNELKIDYERSSDKILMNTNGIYFEALNYKTANYRVDKYKSGKIKNLDNLRRPENLSKLPY